MDSSWMQSGLAVELSDSAQLQRGLAAVPLLMLGWAAIGLAIVRLARALWSRCVHKAFERRGR